MNKLIPLLFFFTMFYAISALAFVPWFSGTALANGTLATSCSKSYPPPSDINFFLGESISAVLDPSNPANAQVIALNGGIIILIF